MQTELLQLPRLLVNLLLRQAQRAPEPSQGWVLCSADGQFRSLPLPPDTDLRAAAAGAPPGRAFAFYRSAKTSQAALSTAETATLAPHTSLYLGMALDTKGVLQLRAWRIADEQMTPLDVSILESNT